MISLRKACAFAMATMVVTTLAGCGGSSGDDSDVETTTLDFATILGPSAQLSQGFQWWADEVESRTDGAVKIKFHFSASLLSGPDTLTGLGDGRTDIAYVVNPYEPVKLALANFSLVPTQHSAQARMVAYAKLFEEVPEFAAEADNANFVPLGVVPISQVVHATSKSVSAPEDFAGLKVRVPGALGRAFELLGATNVALPAEEVYESLERGVIDSVQFPFETVVATKSHEITDSIVMDGTGRSSNSVFAINKDVWEDLSADVQEVLREVSDEYTASKAIEFMSAADAAACAELVQDGTTFVRFADQGWTAEPKYFDPVYEEWRNGVVQAGYEAEVADALWDTFNDLAEAAEADVTYVDEVGKCFDENS